MSIFQYASDLHIEMMKTIDDDTFINVLPPVAPYLILAGDIGNVSPKHVCKLRHFLEYCKANWNTTIYIPGNHEYYGVTIDHGNTILSDICSRLGIKLLAPGSITIDGITIVGTTLWSHIGSTNTEIIEYSITDFSAIRDFNVDAYNTNHKNDVKFLKSVIDVSTPKTCLVVTHHAPSRELVKITSKLFKYSTDLSEAFGTPITDSFDTNNIISWIYGHSHRNRCKVINNIQLLTNQLGYSGERVEVTYNPWMVIEVPEVHHIASDDKMDISSQP